MDLASDIWKELIEIHEGSTKVREQKYHLFRAKYDCFKNLKKAQFTPPLGPSILTIGIRASLLIWIISLHRLELWLRWVVRLLTSRARTLLIGKFAWPHNLMRLPPKCG